MVTNKKSAKNLAAYLVVACAALFLGGCQPAGPKSLLLGEKYIEQENYAKALKYLTRAATLIPEHPQVWNHLGLAYHGLHQPVKAVEAYQRAIRIDRNLPPPHYNLGVLLLEQQHFPQAISELNVFVKLQTNSVAGWVKLGAAFLRMERPDDAEGAFTQALRIDPKNSEAHNGLGLAHVQRKRPREAMQSFNNALQFSPTYGPAVLNQAIVSHQYFADKNLAVERYHAFLSTKPENPIAARVQRVVQSLEAEIVAANEAAAAAEAAARTNQFATFLRTNLASRTEAPTNEPRARPATNIITQAPPAPKTNIVTPSPANAIAAAAPTEPKTNAPAKDTNVIVAAVPSINQPAPLETVPEMKPEPESESEPEPPLTVEVVRVDKEPIFKAAADLPARTATNQIAARRTAEIPETRPLFVPRRDRKDNNREGILSRMNPMRLFRDDGNEPPASARQSPAPSPRPSYPPVVRNAHPTPEPPRLVARYQYRRNVPLKPGNRAEAEKYFRQGAEAHQQRRYQEAIALYRNAMTLDPTYFEPHYNMGLAAYQSKNLPLALAANELAVTAKPDSKDARYNFAFTLREANYPADAANELRKIVAEDPDAERAHFALANLYAQQLDEPIMARRHYLAVLELNANHPDAPSIRQWLANHP